jgi:hypothetical protein
VGGIAAAVLLGALALQGAGATGRRSSPPLPKRTALTDGASSVDELVARLLAALAARDRAALARLRVTEREYLDVILPGNVEPGQPPQRMPEEKARFFWQMLDAKSRFGEQHLLDEFGGRRFHATRVDYKKGAKRWAGFDSYRQLRLALADEQGRAHELGTGSIVDVDGRLKFVSFVRD